MQGIQETKIDPVTYMEIEAWMMDAIVVNASLKGITVLIVKRQKKITG